MAGNALRLEAQDFKREFRRFLDTREALPPQRHARSTARLQGPLVPQMSFASRSSSFKTPMLLMLPFTCWMRRRSRMASTIRPLGCFPEFFSVGKKWSDQRVLFEESFPKDEILTNATIYWVNQAIGTSIRAYKNPNRYPWQPSHNRTPAIEAPAGLTFLTGDAYPPRATVENRVDIFRKEVGTSARGKTQMLSSKEFAKPFVS
jgi:hypothetical protein